MRFVVRDAGGRLERDVAIRLDGAPAAGDLIDALVDYLAWPRVARDGSLLRYAVTIERSGVTLDPSVAAAQSGLRDGDTLIVSDPEVAAAGQPAGPGPGAGPIVVHVALPSGKKIALAPGSYAIGRATASDLHLEDESVSRKHALLHVAADGSVRVEDIGSRNGLFVEDARVTEAAVRDGDRVRLGDAVVTIHHAR